MLRTLWMNECERIASHKGMRNIVYWSVYKRIYASRVCVSSILSVLIEQVSQRFIFFEVIFFLHNYQW